MSLHLGSDTLSARQSKHWNGNEALGAFGSLFGPASSSRSRRHRSGRYGGGMRMFGEGVGVVRGIIDTGLGEKGAVWNTWRLTPS